MSVKKETRTHKDVLYILMTSTSPGAGCFTTNAITYPFVMAVVEKGSFTDYQFLMTQQVIDCDR